MAASLAREDTKPRPSRSHVVVRGLAVSLLLALSQCILLVASKWSCQAPTPSVHISHTRRDTYTITLPSQNSSRVFVVAGLMLTRTVPADLVNAFHYAVQDFNAAQKAVHVDLRFFIGQGGHPLVLHNLASVTQQGQAAPVRGAGAALPAFVQGSFVENMNHGKTFEWFSYAAETFPSSDWILKMDTDVAVDWMAVAKWLQDVTHSLRYIGLVNDFERCGSYPTCPPAGCSNLTGSCWVYMSGGFYGLSTELAKRVVACRYYKSHRVGDEDLQLGKAVKECAANRVEVQLVSVPQKAAWCHSKAANLTHIRNGLFPADCM